MLHKWFMHLPASQFLLKESETINDKLDITSMFAIGI